MKSIFCKKINVCVVPVKMFGLLSSDWPASRAFCDAALFILEELTNLLL